MSKHNKVGPVGGGKKPMTQVEKGELIRALVEHAAGLQRSGCVKCAAMVRKAARVIRALAVTEE